MRPDSVDVPPTLRNGCSDSEAVAMGVGRPLRGDRKSNKGNLEGGGESNQVGGTWKWAQDVGNQQEGSQ